jgi:hypothetical protein
MKLEEAFRHFKISVLTLEGNPMQLRKAIESFQSTDGSSSSGANVMLCSLELKAAGLNLQVASHLLLVHPFFSTNPRQAAAWEEQALGRICRPGQTKRVNIWRFVSTNTIEHTIVRNVRNAKSASVVTTVPVRDDASVEQRVVQIETATTASVTNTSHPSAVRNATVEVVVGTEVVSTALPEAAPAILHVHVKEPTANPPREAIFKMKPGTKMKKIFKHWSKKRFADDGLESQVLSPNPGALTLTLSPPPRLPFNFVFNIVSMF